MEQTEQTDPFSIESVEQKTNELKKKVLEISYRICERMDEYKVINADLKDQHYAFSLELQQEQKELEKQLSVFTKILVSMKKNIPISEKEGSLLYLLDEMKQIKLGVGEIKQRITT